MRVIDLSMSIYTGMPVFPGDPDVQVEVVHTHQSHTWELRRLVCGSHTGTHVDAISHMHSGKQTLDDIPLERFFGKAQVVDLHGNWPSETGLFFTQEAGSDVAGKIIGRNPGFVGGTITEELQRTLLGNSIVTYTDLVNLELLPIGKNFMFYGLPLKIKDGDGSPVRAIAIVDS
jgi:kynurenine formamidase